MPDWEQKTETQPESIPQPDPEPKRVSSESFSGHRETLTDSSDFRVFLRLFLPFFFEHSETFVEADTAAANAAVSPSPATTPIPGATAPSTLAASPA